MSQQESDSITESQPGFSIKATRTITGNEIETPIVTPWVGWSIVVAVGLTIWAVDGVLGWRPEHVAPEGWRLLAIFLATIVAFILRPLPGGAVVLLALLTSMVTGTLTPELALGGYADPTVWLVLAAYMISRAVIQTGLARRIALHFIRWLGSRTLGLAYALVATDTVLAGVIPSNAARVGGVILPIARALAEYYRSFPGSTSALLGTFLILAIYQSDIVACAMFYTGQASNPLAAVEAARVSAVPAVPSVALLGGSAAASIHQPFSLHYGNWLLYSSVPAIVSLLIIPAATYLLCPPVIRYTPDAPQLARQMLRDLGPIRRDEFIVLTIFISTCISWMVCGFLFGPKTISVIALISVALLLLSGVLRWQDVITEKGAWDVFLWYGGLVQLGNLLRQTNIPQTFAQSLADHLSALPVYLLFLAVVLIYFYAHYAFASITSHIVSMYGAFVSVLIVAGVPAPLAASALAFITNLSAGLTHYGTTHGPILFSVGYVSAATWWKLGFRLSIVNLSIWLSIGLFWWKICGLW